MGTGATITPPVTTSSGKSFTVAHLGRLGEVDRFEISLPTFKRPIRGKVFLKGILGLTGMEASITKLPAGAAVPFLHRHRAHEELYVFIGGRGQMQVDGETFDVEEGTVVRIATGGARAIRAAADEELRFLCIQAEQGSMPDAEAADDGERVDERPVWP
jgi:mannose-6-phosphate isomerase-like protein (cupin superfamily)